MRDYDSHLARLIAASDSTGHDPFRRVEFPEALDGTRLLMPAPLLSLYHHPVYDTLDAQQRWQLSLLETVNFFSINIHGERALVTGLEQRLYRSRTPWDNFETSRYLQRFIHEENSHTHMLAEFCHRYHGGILPDASLALDGSALSPLAQDLQFFGRTFVLEGFLGYLNLRVMRDDSLEPTARAVHHAHHSDESRHIAFDRAVLKLIVDMLIDQGGEDEIRIVAGQLDQYRQVAQRRLYNASIYRRIGLSNGVQLGHEARQARERQAIEAHWMESTMQFLDKLGLSAGALA